MDDSQNIQGERKIEKIHTIYDRASKRCLSISKPTTIMLINGLYGADYPLDSQVTYNWTEHHDDDLRKTLSDTIITINSVHSYHIEFQIYDDDKLVMRVFDYGYRHAVTTQPLPDVLEFPKPVIVYLYEDGHNPQYHKLLIRFPGQGEFTYKVPIVHYLKMDKEELERRKLIVLIPFQLLRLKKAMKKKRTQKNLEALKTLIQYDILGSIDKNVAAGNITVSDARVLKGITWQLYRHIYQKYDEMEKAGVNQLMEEAMILEVDIIEKKHRDEVKRIKADNEKVIQEKDNAIKAKDNAIKAKDNAIKELSEKLRHFGISEEEILKMTTLQPSP